MKRNEIISIGILALIIFAFACNGGKQSADSLNSAYYLPGKIDSIGIEKTSEVRTFAGESLYEYINGGAEIYHLYHFIEVATADYKIDETEIVADIYRFGSSDFAYGLYSTIRPDNPEIIQLGVEGFAFESGLNFVKDCYLIKLIGYKQTSKTADAVKILAEIINKSLPGKTAKPAAFALFPQNNRIEHTEKIYAESFLGQNYLSDIYSQNYQFDIDTLTLFITADDSGGKFQQWHNSADIIKETAVEDLPFEDGKTLLINHSYYGKIIAGSYNGKLLGIVNYNDSHKDFLASWLTKLK